MLRNSVSDGLLAKCSVEFGVYLYIQLSIYFCELKCVSQKRVSDPLDLELQMVVSHQMGAGNCTQ